jgi:hypothetical protein
MIAGAKKGGFGGAGWTMRITTALLMSLMLTALFSSGAMGSTDTVAPTVTWTGPLPNSVVYVYGDSSLVTVTATIVDPAPSSGLQAYASLQTGNGNSYGCPVSGDTITCTTHAGSWVEEDDPDGQGSHWGMFVGRDNAGNLGYSQFVTFTIVYGTGTPVKPSLSLGSVAPYWASMADYTAGRLTVDMTVSNTGGNTAYNVSLTGASSNNGVTLDTTIPVALGDIDPGGSATAGLAYIVPTGVGGFLTNVTAAAYDEYGVGYTYP